MLGKIVLKDISDGFMTNSKTFEENCIAKHCQTFCDRLKNIWAKHSWDSRKIKKKLGK